MNYLLVIGLPVGIIAAFEIYGRLKVHKSIQHEPEEKEYFIPKKDVEVIYYSEKGASFDLLESGTKCAKAEDGRIVLVLKEHGPISINPDTDLKYDNILNLATGNSRLIIDPLNKTDYQSDKWKRLFEQLKSLDYGKAKDVVEEIEARTFLEEQRRKRKLEQINYKERVNEIVEEAELLSKRKTVRDKLPETITSYGDRPQQDNTSKGR